MVITIYSGTWALIYELALIIAIFGLDWIGSGFSGNFMDWIGLSQQKLTHVQLWNDNFLESDSSYFTENTIGCA